MESCHSVPDMQKLLTELKASYSEHYGLSDVLTDVGEDLFDALQKRQSLKVDYLTAIEEKLFLGELEKQPEKWLTMEVAESQLTESKDILAEISTLSDRTAKVQEIVDVASDALDTLKEKLDILEQKIGKLEEKYMELSKSSVANIQNMQQSDLKCCAIKVSELLTTARIERDIIRSKVKRMENTLHLCEGTASLLSRNVTASRGKLARMDDMLTELEKLSGMRCRLKDDTSLEIKFLSTQDFLSTKSLPEDSGDDCKSSSIPDDTYLIVTLTFRENEHQILEIENVQTNQMLDGLETLISSAKVDKDVPKLITELKHLWKTHVPLITEISQIRCRHAVDWIQEKGLLLLMPRKSSSVVCALKVPSTYPFSGQIVLDSILGHTSLVTPEDIQPPANMSLKSWVIHLEDLFSQP